MDFSLLGPFEARDDDDGLVLVPGGKPRALLALLLLNGDRVVSTDRIVDDLWGEQVPETAPKMVQIFVSQLRKQLPPGTLRTRPPGYLAELAQHSLDLRRFEQLAEEGRALLADGRAAEAAERLQSGLGLWRGPALGEFDEPFAAFESARLEEQRLAVLEDRIDADLACARHAELIGELTALVQRHPGRERLRGQLMLALYRSGRHGEALDSFQSFRRMLADDLGIDPPARLRALERQILQQDPAIDPAQRTPAPRRDPAAVAPSAPPPGRQRELAHLRRLLDEAIEGRRGLAFVTGEAGIGKTTILEAFLQSIPPGVATARGQCVEHRGAGEPYLAILEAVGRLCRGAHGDAVVPLLARQAPMWLMQMPWLLGDDDLEPLQRRTVGATHARMLREMLEALETISAQMPLVLVLEDLHWSDPSTIDLLDALARRDEAARLLVVGTFRRGGTMAPRHPVDRLAQNLRGRGLCAEIAVGPLDPGAVEEYAAERLSADLADLVAGVLHERTGGHPLFVTSLLDSWLEHGLLDESPPDVVRLGSGLPSTVRELIEASLTELDPGDRALLAAAAVDGVEFSAATVVAAAGRAPVDVESRLDALAAAGGPILPTDERRWPDGTVNAAYRFTHDLQREVLYDSMPASLRAQTHGAIGRRLDEAYRSAPKEIAATAAEHFVLAGDSARGVVALRRAAERALERLAHQEALEHLTAGDALLERMPEGAERWSEELALQPMLAAARVATAGWSSPDAETALLRSREVAERLGQRDELGWALFRLGSLYEVRGEYGRAEPLLEEALTVSGSVGGTGLLTDSHARLACSLFHQGAFDRALEHAELGLAVHDGAYFNPVTAVYGDDAGAACHGWAALSLWFLGYPDRARRRALEAVTLTEDPRRRHGYANALVQAAIVEGYRLDFAAARAHAEAAIAAAAHDGYHYRLAMAMIVHGWAMAAEGMFDRGIAEIEEGLDASAETGAHMDDPYYFTLLADACARAGRTDAAFAALEAAHASAGRRFFFESELVRIEGELLARVDRGKDAEIRLRQAVDIARDRTSPTLELRAAMSLAARLRSEGRAEEAATLVSSPYSRLDEGHATHDLVAARALLDALGSLPG